MSSDEKIGCFSLWLLLSAFGVGFFYLVTDSAIGAAEDISLRDAVEFISDQKEVSMYDKDGRRRILDTMISKIESDLKVDLDDSIYDAMKSNKNISDLNINYLDTGDQKTNSYIKHISDGTLITITANHKTMGKIRILFGGIHRSVMKARGGEAFLLFGQAEKVQLRGRSDIEDVFTLLVPIYAGE